MECKNQQVNDFVRQSAELLKPDQIVWIDGSEEQLESLRQQAMATGEIVKLNQKKLPNCYYHRTAVNDVARVESRTFICSRE